MKDSGTNWNDYAARVNSETRPDRMYCGYANAWCELVSINTTVIDLPTHSLITKNSKSAYSNATFPVYTYAELGIPIGFDPEGGRVGDYPTPITYQYKTNPTNLPKWLNYFNAKT